MLTILVTNFLLGYEYSLPEKENHTSQLQAPLQSRHRKSPKRHIQLLVLLQERRATKTKSQIKRH